MTISFRKLGNASDLRKWKDWAASTIRQSFLNSGKFLLWPKQVWIFFLAKKLLRMLANQVMVVVGRTITWLG
jgi:hypothetical protein